MSSLFSLSNKRCMVVGASKGIGKHCAKVLMRHGATVVGAARNEEALKSTAEELIKGEFEHKGSFKYVQMDICDRQSVIDGVDKAIDKVGAIDILVNTVASIRPQSFVDIDETTWQYVIDTNVTGYYRVSKALAKSMIESGTRGSIIHFSSILSSWVKPYHASFSASKAAIEQLTRNMAYELAGEGIRVNTIVPGYFESRANLQFLATPQGEQFVKELVPRRLGAYHELDGALLLLASDAGSYISGTSICVDGASQLG